VKSNSAREEHSVTRLPYMINEQSDKDRLRVGLLVDSLMQPRWIFSMVDEISHLPFVDLCVVVMASQPRASGNGITQQSSVWKDSVAGSTHLLYRLYMKLDGRRFATDPDPLATMSIEPLVAGRPVLYLRSQSIAHGADLEAADLKAVLPYELDVALGLTSASLASQSLGIARYGLWSFRRHRDGADPLEFWEVMDGSPITEATLQVCTEDLDQEKAIYRSYSRADRLSVRANASKNCLKSSRLVGRKLRELHERGPRALDDGEHPVEHRRSRNHGRTEPTNLEMVRFVAKLGARRIRNQIAQTASFTQWTLAYQLNSSPRLILDGPDASHPEFKHLIPPKDRFWADPFPVFRNGRYYIFCEEYPYHRRKGRISVMELDRNGRCSSPVTVLDRAYHLAYPFIFEWQGEYFMIPETESNKTIELYRCTSFPDQWELFTVLIDNISAVDTTLTEIGGRWWMFTNIAAEGTSDWDTELHLFHAPSPVGPWTAHKSNPVKSDVRSARPAGSIFSLDGKVYRPSQDCSVRYGHSMSINEIVEIDTDKFEEVEVSRILPEWAPGLVGTHTINSVEGLTVFDGLLRRSRYH
jgi:hypothetical protein